MISHSDSITNLMGAMLKVQGAVDGVRKDGKNQHFKSKYATLESIVDTIRPACQEAGIVVMQSLGEFANGCMSLETMLVHAKTGEWLRSQAQSPVAKQDPQGVGSAQTYLARYSLMAAFNLPPVEDDGNAASKPRLVDPDYGVLGYETDKNDGGPINPPKKATVNPAWQERQKADNLIKAMKGAKSIDDLDALTDDAKELPDSLKQEVRNAYIERKRALERQEGTFA